MLLLIEVDNGEQWEDYHSWVKRAYQVRTKKSSKELESEWKNFIVRTLQEKDIAVNPHWTETITIDSPRKDSATRKEVKRVHREHSFENWLIANYNVKEVKFETIHIH